MRNLIKRSLVIAALTAAMAGQSVLANEQLPKDRAGGDMFLDAVFARQARLAHAMREGVKAAGLSLFPKESPSDALTAISAPGSVDGQAIYKNLRVQYGITAAGGQDHLKGKIFRVSHMGYMDTFDVILTLAAIEMVLKGLGHPVKLGSGVAKAQELLMAKG